MRRPTVPVYAAILVRLVADAVWIRPAFVQPANAAMTAASLQLAKLAVPRMVKLVAIPAVLAH